MSTGINVVDESAITIGHGVLDFDALNLGQLSGDVELEAKTEYYEARFGTPKLLIGRYPIGEDAVIKASLAEFNAANYEKLNDAATLETLTAGTTAVVDEAVVLTAVVWTVLAHEVVSSVVVKNTAGTTTYTENTDYVVDYQTGRVRRISGGAITDGQTVNVSYSYATSAAKRYWHGGKTTVTAKAMTFTHTRPNGKYVKIYFAKAQLITPITPKFQEETILLQDISIQAIADTTAAAGKQLYYIEFQS